VLLICLTVIVFTNRGFTQTIDPDYTIADWYGFRSAAVSFTLDDGSPNQYSAAVPLFEEFNFRFTWFIVTGSGWSWQPDWSALNNAASSGFEIGSHTVTHRNFAEINDSLENVELRDCKSVIESHINNYKCVSVAYPYCVAGNESICENYYIAARTCSGSLVSKNPGDFMAISSFVCGPEGPVKTADDFISKAQLAAKSEKWCVFLIHGIDGDGGWSSVSSDSLRKILENYRANENKYWVDTFGNVARYIKERNAVSITETIRDTCISMELTDALNDTIFNIPLTLRRTLPSGWASAVVQQAGRIRKTKIVEVDSVKYIQFDAVPDSGSLLLTRDGVTGIKNHSGLLNSSPELMPNYPNPFNPGTKITFELKRAGHAIMKIYDVNGREKSTLLDKDLPAGHHSIDFTADDLASGTYYCKLKVDGYIQTQKMILLR
ncbi:MAG: polysaccharide deacetylase family protein, partial [Calditrichaceae bacterium]